MTRVVALGDLLGPIGVCNISVQSHEKVVVKPIKEAGLNRWTRAFKGNSCFPMLIIPNDLAFRAHKNVGVRYRKPNIDLLTCRNTKRGTGSDRHPSLAEI